MSTEGSNKAGAVGKTVFWLLAVIALVLGITVHKYYNKAPLTNDQLQAMGAVVFETPRTFSFQGLTKHDGQPLPKKIRYKIRLHHSLQKLFGDDNRETWRTKFVYRFFQRPGPNNRE